MIFFIDIILIDESDLKTAPPKSRAIRIIKKTKSDILR